VRPTSQVRCPAGPDSAQPGGGTIVVTYVHGNHLGVPLSITDSAGNAATTPNDYLAPAFPGQSKTLTDLYYNRYRDYDPTTGRYIQADPIGLGGGQNDYAYAGNNPIRYTDPMGLQSNPAIPRGPGIPIPTWNGGPDYNNNGIGDWDERQGKALQDFFEGCINLLTGKKDKSCPPCKTVSGKIVPVGTIGYRFDRVPPSRPHRPLPGDHYNLLQANQNPNNCRCFWRPLKQATEIAPPGSIPVEDFVN